METTHGLSAMVRGVSAALLLTGLGMLLSACGTSHVSTPSSATAGVTLVGVAGSPDPAETYTKASPLLDSSPDHWGGAYVDGDGWLVIKYVGQSAEDAQRALSAVGVTGGFALKPSNVSTATLQRQLAIVERFMHGSDAGYVSGAGPEFARSALVISLSRADASTETAIRGLLKGTGPDPVFEVNG